MFNKKTFGFTLAEILVTLAVLGIIASMTVPTLVNDVQKNQFITAYKESYAILSQVVQRIAYNNGGTLKGICTNGDENCMVNKFIPYLAYTRTCFTSGSDSTGGGCWYKFGTVTALGGGNYGWWGDSGVIMLNNGSFVRIYYPSASCTTTSWWGSIQACGYITVDVNGYKKPNAFGIDMFHIYLLQNGIKPFGFSGDNYNPATYCVEGSKTSDNGLGCAAKYLYQ